MDGRSPLQRSLVVIVHLDERGNLSIPLPSVLCAHDHYVRLLNDQVAATMAISIFHAGRANA
ncbi:MAG: hypothetical protein M3P52_01510, partial [Actinomycetota bacterium]|nr:hypothetical protein [Actinomycetota bacterium]